VHTFAEQLVRFGHEVDVICAPTPDKKPQIYNVVEVGYPRVFSKNLYLSNIYEMWFSLSVGLNLRKLHTQNKYDIIHFFENPATAYMALLLSKKDMPPFVFSSGRPVSGDKLDWESQNVSRPIRTASDTMHNYVFRHVDGITVSSARLKEVLVAHLKLEEKKVMFTPFVAAEPEIFQADFDTKELRQKLGISLSDPIILCLGEVSPYKNQLSIIKAMPDIVKNHPTIKLLLVGTVLKSYRIQMEKVIQEHNLQENIIFTGFVKDYSTLSKYYNLADIYVLLSRSEGNMPKTTIEAMSCGKPIIVSNIPQNKEGAIYGDEMIFVDPYDIKVISGTVNRLLDNSRLRNQLGKNARRTIAEYYTPQVVCKRMLVVYDQIIGKKRSIKKL